LASLFGTTASKYRFEACRFLFLMVAMFVSLACFRYARAVPPRKHLLPAGGGELGAWSLELGAWSLERGRSQKVARCLSGKVAKSLGTKDGKGAGVGGQANSIPVSCSCSIGWRATGVFTPSSPPRSALGLARSQPDSW
jgi:hypothetical protein